MAAQDVPLGTPGQDDSQHAHTLHQGVATALADIRGQKIGPEEVAPPKDQPAPSFEPQTEADLEEIIEAEKGKPRTDPSKNFLKVLLGRLRKQHPQGLIKIKEN